MADDAELIIAGGGLNGMLLAIACAGAGLSTIVIDRQDPAAMTTDRFDGRTSAIAYGSRLVFYGVGVWAALGGEAARGAGRRPPRRGGRPPARAPRWPRRVFGGGWGGAPQGGGGGSRSVRSGSPT